MVNTTSANSSVTWSFQDILTIGNIDCFLQRDLNISGVTLKENFTQVLNKLNDKVLSMQQDYILLRNEIRGLKIEIWDTWDSIYYVERDMANFHQYSRRDNIEISGIPGCYNEKLEFTVVRILKRNGLPNLSSSDIVACHRLKKTQERQTS